MTPRYEDELAIGQSLKEARTRMGMEVAEAEDRTKIRAKYIRALENEDWEILPAPAYIRGFLRTYGQILGLDGEMLADRYRRFHETQVSGPISHSEPVLTERRRGPSGNGGGPSRGLLIGLVAAAIVVVLLILGLTGGGDESSGPKGKGKAGKGKARIERKVGKSENEPDLETVDATLTAISGAQVCVVGGGDSALVDTQVLPEGAVEDFSGEKTYRVDIEGGGIVRLEVGKESEKISATEPSSVEADSNGIRPIDYAGPDCP